jgi:ring-1,2-phenylacetyl-CoA epoxidase subunit PaaD
MVIDARPDIAQIRSWLEQVPGPEVPAISIVDLGLVRDVASFDYFKAH